MDMRTRSQEQKYNQALGYGWGRKDAPHAERKDWTADVLGFATFFALYEDMTGHHKTLKDAWEYFRELTLPEQAAYGTEWMRMAHYA